MLYSKSGFPEDSEIVLCTVTKVHYNMVFVTLDEYQNKTGVIHISEIAPGRIRNIRDYVVEGKKVICKVLRINHERGNIDLSLRRVNDKQRRTKNSQIKQEQLAEKIIELVAKDLKLDVKTLYRTVSDKVFQEYDLIHACFQDAVMEEFNLEKLGLEKKVLEKLKEAVFLRIKPPEVMIAGNFSIITYDPNGVQIVKDALKFVKGEGVEIKYMGAGKYRLTIKAGDYKTAEDILEKITENVIASVEDKDGEASFERIEIKS